MSTTSSYFRNTVKCREIESTKRRLSSDEEFECNNYKKRLLSTDNRQCNVDINVTRKETRFKASTSSFDDCADEETFINTLREISKSFLDFSTITKLCSTEEFSQLQQNTTQAITNLTSQPYIGLIEQDKLTLLLDFLLKLYKYKGTLSKFQEKSKMWAVTQLKKSLCLPTSILFEKEYLHPASLQTIITKMMTIIAKENCRNKKIPNEIIHILGLVGLVTLKMPVCPPPSFVESILQILYENKPPLSTLQDLLDLVNILVIEDKIDINSESLAFLWTLHPSALEDIIVDSLIESKAQTDKRMVRLKLGEACCHNSLLFQKVVNMFVSAWLQTGGDTSIAASLSKFVSHVQNSCINNSFFALFPDSLWPLVLLLQIPATDFLSAMQNSHAYSIIEILSQTVSSGLCHVKDILILFLIFPSWYQVLLTLSATEPSTTNVLKLLVKAD